MYVFYDNKNDSRFSRCNKYLILNHVFEHYHSSSESSSTNPPKRSFMSDSETQTTTKNNESKIMLRIIKRETLPLGNFSRISWGGEIKRWSVPSMTSAIFSFIGIQPKFCCRAFHILFFHRTQSTTTILRLQKQLLQQSRLGERSLFTCGRVAAADAAASDVADPSAVPARQVPHLVGVVATDGRHVAVATHPASRHTSRHVGTPDRCIVTTTHTHT